MTSNTMLVAGSPVPDWQQRVKFTGEAIAKSKMFSCENEYQGQVIAISCLVTGRDPLSIPQEFHLMGGKLSLRSDAMLGRLQKAGGSHRVLERTPDAATIEVTYRGQTVKEQLTWEDAKKEPFVYAGKPKEILPKLLAGKMDGLQLTANYSTPRRRMQHLWARVVSDAVRAVAPELVTGSYTPEEVADFSGLAGVSYGAIAVEAAEVKPAETPLDKTPPTQVQPAELKPAETSTEQASTPNPSALSDTEPLIAEVKKLAAELKLPKEKLVAAIQKRGGAKLADLPTVALEDLRNSLRSLLAAGQTAEPSTPHKSLNVNGPMTAELRSEICEKMKQVAQGIGGIEITERVKTELQSRGLKLADLTFEQGRKLLLALDTKQIGQFFQSTLAIKPEPALELDEPALVGNDGGIPF